MTVRLSPLGLPLEYGSNTSVTLVGAAALAQAGTSTSSVSTEAVLDAAVALAEAGTVTAAAGGNIAANIVGAEAFAQAGSVLQRGPIKLSPIGLPLLGYGAPFLGVSVTLTGVAAQAEAGNMSVSLPQTGVFSQLGPLMLPGPIRTVIPFVGGISVTLIGAQANAQAEEMEGADAIIYIDGATAFADAGLLIGKAQLITESAFFTPIFTERANFTTTITATLTSTLSYQVRGTFTTTEIIKGTFKLVKDQKANWARD